MLQTALIRGVREREHNNIQGNLAKGLYLIIHLVRVDRVPSSMYEDRATSYGMEIFGCST